MIIHDHGYYHHVRPGDDDDHLQAVRASGMMARRNTNNAKKSGRSLESEKERAGVGEREEARERERKRKGGPADNNQLRREEGITWRVFSKSISSCPASLVLVTGKQSQKEQPSIIDFNPRAIGSSPFSVDLRGEKSQLAALGAIEIEFVSIGSQYNGRKTMKQKTMVRPSTNLM